MKEEEGMYLKELNIYIIYLFNFFWKNPGLALGLIENADINDVKSNLASFFCNFFFENYLSPYSLQDNLIFIITSLLKKEIMNLNKENDYNSFLEETRAGFLLGELKYKNEIRTFLRKIINPTIEKLEFKYWRMELNIDGIFLNMKKENEENIEEEESEKIKESYENQKILNKYFINLTQDYIEKEKAKYKNTSRENTYNEYLKMITNEVIIDNKHFFEKFEICKEFIGPYKINFCIIIDCLNQLISDIKSNINSFPDSLKLICKLISILIQKKFPNISIKQKNAFICKFIFNNIFIPFLSEPSEKLLLTKYLISKSTQNNCKIIAKIFRNIFLGEIFNDRQNNYAPFNFFFVEKIKDIVDIYDQIIRVNLPDIANKVIKGELNENYKLNNEEMISSKLICFQFDDIVAIIDSIGRNKEFFFKDNIEKGFKKTYEKITNESCSEIIRSIKDDKKIKLSLKSINMDKDNKNNKENKDNKDNNSKRSRDSKENKRDSLKEIPKEESLEEKEDIRYYFYIFEILVNENYKEFFKLESKNTIASNLVGATEEEIIKNNIQKVKDCIYIILENYETLSEKRFPLEKAKNSKSIFKELKKATSLNNSFINNTIPSKWYLSSLFEYLEKLPDEYIKNDYELLYNEIKKDINDYIEKKLNFDFLSTFQEKLQFSQKNLDNSNYMKEKLIELEINEKVNKFIISYSIPIILEFDHNSNTFEIISENLQKSSGKNKVKKKSNIIKQTNIIKTIDSFIKAFPNIVKYQILQDEDILELIKNLKLPQKIDEYMMLIKPSLEQIFNNNQQAELAQERIYDYIMCRIYDKIFPQTYEEDDKIYQKCFLLSWVEPKHFIEENKIFNVESIKNDFHHFITQLEEEKSPLFKFRNLRNIFKLIRDSAEFYGKEIEQMNDAKNVLLYLLIKEQPTKLYSTCKYMDLFLSYKLDINEKKEVINILSLCEKIDKIDYTDLSNVTREEYISKCKEASQGIAK